jgi:hypothetical protein
VPLGRGERREARARQIGCDRILVDSEQTLTDDDSKSGLFESLVVADGRALATPRTRE